MILKNDFFNLMINSVFGIVSTIAKLCYMDRDSVIIHVKTEDVSEDVANDVENEFDTSNYEVKRPSPKGKNKKVIGLMKDELGEKTMTEFVHT